MNPIVNAYAFPWPWIAKSDPSPLSGALAVVDDAFLQGLRELDLPDGRFKDWLSGTASAELDRRAGRPHQWPLLDLPTSEIRAAQSYVGSAAAVVSNQRWGWGEEIQEAGDARLLVLYLVGLELAKAAVIDAQTAESKPSAEPVALARLERIEAHTARLEANAQRVEACVHVIGEQLAQAARQADSMAEQFEVHVSGQEDSVAAIAAGINRLFNVSAVTLEGQAYQAGVLYQELERSIRALKTELKTNIEAASQAAGHEVAMEVRRWGGNIKTH